jgi:ubiquinone/menaquinone biosynthesis C-methylase UbiE
VSSLNLRDVLDRERERKKWQDPYEVLERVGLKRGDVFIDLGCGPGFFAVPAGNIVGSGGKVFAVDIDEEAISILKERAEKGELNIEAEVGFAEETIFCESCADIVFFGIVLHDFRDQGKVLINSKKMLKKKGKLVNVDFKEKPMSKGHP